MGRLVRIRNSYSDRNKIREISRNIQIDSFSDETRVVLKNEIIILLSEYEKFMEKNHYSFEIQQYLGNLFAKDVFNLPLHSGFNSYNNIVSQIYTVFDKGEVYDILDFIEYFANNIDIKERSRDIYGQLVWKNADLFERFNHVFTSECIGFRFVKKMIVPITNESEINEIEHSIDQSNEEKIGKHLALALEYLSDRENPKYDDSVAQSVKALEGLAVVYYGKKSESFDKMIASIKNKFNLHPKLESLLKDIYHYASDNDGIRHVNSGEGYNVSFAEAKMILVIVSSVVNYFLTLKAK